MFQLVKLNQNKKVNLDTEKVLIDVSTNGLMG